MAEDDQSCQSAAVPCGGGGADHDRVNGDGRKVTEENRCIR